VWEAIVAYGLSTRLCGLLTCPRDAVRFVEPSFKSPRQQVDEASFQCPWGCFAHPFPTGVDLADPLPAIQGGVRVGSAVKQTAYS